MFPQRHEIDLGNHITNKSDAGNISFPQSTWTIVWVQSINGFFLSNINDNHPTCSIIISDFNAERSKWCNSDKCNRAGIELHNITTSAGYSQLINEPTNFVNKTSFCIDLIFSSDLNITRNCGIEKTIHEKCHHDIIYGTLNFNVPLPPPYYRNLGL